MGKYALIEDYLSEMKLRGTQTLGHPKGFWIQLTSQRKKESTDFDEEDNGWGYIQYTIKPVLRIGFDQNVVLQVFLEIGAVVPGAERSTVIRAIRHWKLERDPVIRAWLRELT